MYLVQANDCVAVIKELLGQWQDEPSSVLLVLSKGMDACMQGLQLFYQSSKTSLLHAHSTINVPTAWCQVTLGLGCMVQAVHH